MTADKQPHPQSKQSFSNLIFRIFSDLILDIHKAEKQDNFFVYYSDFLMDGLRNISAHVQYISPNKLSEDDILDLLALSCKLNRQKEQLNLFDEVGVDDTAFYAISHNFKYCRMRYLIFNFCGDYIESDIYPFFYEQQKAVRFVSLRQMYKDYQNLCEYHDKGRKDT